MSLYQNMRILPCLNLNHLSSIKGIFCFNRIQMVLAHLYRKTSETAKPCSFHLSPPTELWGIWGYSSLLKGWYPDSGHYLHHITSQEQPGLLTVSAHAESQSTLPIHSLIFSVLLLLKAITVSGTSQSNAVLSCYTSSFSNAMVIKVLGNTKAKHWSRKKLFAISQFLPFVYKWIWGYRRISKYIDTIIL